jgi:hypothetical protein
LFSSTLIVIMLLLIIFMEFRNRNGSIYLAKKTIRKIKYNI